jgi:CTP:molybdopterin cytidylyltransferase MocA
VSRIAGLLLAAGSGRRFGGPKALADTGHGPWVLRALDVLGQCDPRIVVVGARGDEVATLLPPEVTVVSNPDHPTGMASSLRAGLSRLPADADAVLVTLVDLPDISVAVAARVLAAACPDPRVALARAVFSGRAGHPVLIGRRHIAGLLEWMAGAGPDTGAGGYLAEHCARRIDCSDLADGRDRDTTE